MDTREAVLKVTLNRFKIYCRTYGNYQQLELDTAIIYLEKAAQLGECRYQISNSIRWNRSRVSVKRAVISELQKTDIQILDAIDWADYYLNLYCEAMASTGSTKEQVRMYAEAIANLTQAKQEIKRFYPQGIIERQLTLMDISIC